MKRLSLLVLILSALIPAQSQSQEFKIERVPAEFIPATNPEWGNDVRISSVMPTGAVSGAGRSNGTAFTAVPDTNTFSGRNLVIYRTTNFGTTWTPFVTITGSYRVDKSKMVVTSDDSIHCFYLGNETIRYFNVEGTTLHTYDTLNIRDFDVVTSSQGGTYLFVDIQRDNRILRAASSDAGATWPQRAVVTSAGATPRVFMNRKSTGTDSLVLNYYGPVKLDTARSVIRQARYREVAPGNLASAGFSDVNVDTTFHREQFGSVKINNVIWFFNTKRQTSTGEGVTPRDIECKVSLNAGGAYQPVFNISANPLFDEHSFTVANYAAFGGGVDVVFQSDTNAAGPPSNAKNGIFHGFIPFDSPGALQGRERISEHPPMVRSDGLPPIIFEYYDVDGEVGALWIGLNGSTPGVYYDRYNASPTGVTPIAGIPEAYSLAQNYPNPFNPSTTIEFSIPRNENVTLKVYDMLGREVRTLVSDNLAAGSYKTRFDAGNLASGVYFYVLNAGKFTESRKLMIMK